MPRPDPPLSSTGQIARTGAADGGWRVKTAREPRPAVNDPPKHVEGIPRLALGEIRAFADYGEQCGHRPAPPRMASAGRRRIDAGADGTGGAFAPRCSPPPAVEPPAVPAARRRSSPGASLYAAIAVFVVAPAFGAGLWPMFHAKPARHEAATTATVSPDPTPRPHPSAPAADGLAPTIQGGDAAVDLAGLAAPRRSGDPSSRPLGGGSLTSGSSAVRQLAQLEPSGIAAPPDAVDEPAAAMVRPKPRPALPVDRVRPPTADHRPAFKPRAAAADGFAAIPRPAPRPETEPSTVLASRIEPPLSPWQRFWRLLTRNQAPEGDGRILLAGLADDGPARAGRQRASSSDSAASTPADRDAEPGGGGSAGASSSSDAAGGSPAGGGSIGSGSAGGGQGKDDDKGKGGGKGDKGDKGDKGKDDRD